MMIMMMLMMVMTINETSRLITFDCVARNDDRAKKHMTKITKCNHLI